jgi:MFS family permease
MQEKDFGRAKAILAVGVVMFAIGQSLLFVVVAPLAREVGLSEVQFGWAFTLGNLGLVVGSTIWGTKSDAIGRKPVFVMGLMGATFGILLMALTLKAGQVGLIAGWTVFGLLALARAVYGGLASAIYPVATAYMADITPPRDRAAGMALIGASNGIGSVLGPALGGSLAFLGALFPLYAAVVMSALGCIWAALFLREPAKHAEQQKVDLKFTDPRIVPYLIIWACFFMVFISLQFITAFYIQDKFGVTETDATIRIASVALVTMAAVIVVLQGFLFQVIRISPRIALRLCPPSFAIGAGLLAFAPSPTMLVIGYGMIGASFAFASPGISGSASLSVAPHEQGTMAGYTAAAGTGGALFAPVFGTTIYQIAPNAPMLMGMGVFTVLSIYALTIKVPEAAHIEA